MKGVIYCYYVNQKYYVGKTYTQERKRKDKHKFEALTKQSNTPFARAIRKYGWEKVQESYMVLETIENDSLQELNRLLIEAENDWIYRLDCLVPKGYNVKNTNANGLPYSPDEKSPEYQEYRREIYERISNSLKGKYLNGVNSKRIICIDNGIEYPSICEAARQLQIRHDSISSMLNGRRYSANGYRFKYVDGPEPRAHGQRKAIKCIETGKEFDSVVAASLFYTGKSDQKGNIISSIKRNGTFRGLHFQYIQDNTVPS